MASNVGSAVPNFYLWGAWKTRIIKEPFLTKKVPGSLKKVVLGDTFIVALSEKGKVYTWGKDPKNGCLGLDTNVTQAHSPEELKIPDPVQDIQIGNEHVVALTNMGQVWAWGNNEKGQLGLGKDHGGAPVHRPTLVELEQNMQVMQIAAVKNSTFALSTSGLVYAWGENKDNILGLEEANEFKRGCFQPRRLTMLTESVRRLEVFEGKTIIAHVRNSEAKELDSYDTGSQEESGGQEVEIFQGINEMRKAMEKTQEWWNHLVTIKHGQPYNIPHDVAIGTDDKDVKTADGRSIKNKATIEEDMEVDLEKLQRAERHLDALLQAAMQELHKAQNLPGTKNVKFILCMFIDECRLRREKVQSMISARHLTDVKRQTQDISAYSVTDFGANANEEIRKIIAVTKELQQMLEKTRRVNVVIPMAKELKQTLIECLECKLQLHDTRVELLKAAEAKPSDPMIPALRIIKDRWNNLKHFSLYALYLDCEQRNMDFQGDDNKHFEYLVKTSNDHIEELLDIDKDRIISHDTLVPALCYDLLRENAELRKMTNSYQLYALLLHHGAQITNAVAGVPRGGPGAGDKAIGDQRQDRSIVSR
mmetsp:Transcript_58122/g.138287  ORF Transcript_58122/g.138287 Transcript_58122/m.138287 type:complete len:591 (-) Transcript_58122:187-1959(-)